MKDAPESKELVTIEKKDAFAFFTEPKAADPVLARIRHEIDSFKPDVTTAAGRKSIASIAYRVAQSKTYLDGVGKNLVAEYKEIPKKIDATRKRLRDTLDEWKDEVRRPLTEWEDAEKSRVDAIKSAMGEFQTAIEDDEDRDSGALRRQLQELRSAAITKQFYAEFAVDAADLRDKAVRRVEARLALAEKREAEAAAAARQQAEAEAKARQEREDQIAKEAAEAAERKAAEAAKAEREASERREMQLRLDKEAAERRALEAAQQAKREMEEKAEAERAEQARREADKKHRATVNNAALAAFVEHGVPEDMAKEVVRLIASRAIPAVSIAY